MTGLAGPLEEVTPYPFVDDDGLDVDPRYRELQRRGPIRVQLAHGEPCWLATGYDDVRTIYTDRRFGKTLGIGRVVPRPHPMPPMDPALLANMDPPRHTRIRRLAMPAFARPRVRDCRAWVEGLVDGLLDAMVDHGAPADFRSLVAWELPGLVLTGTLGIPAEEASIFRGFIAGMLAPDAEPAARREAHQQLHAYILGLIAERRRNPTDDLLNDLVVARDEDDRLTEDELVMLTQSIFLGGFETTVTQLGSTVWTLMAHRHLWSELLDDPGLMGAAMEELWRWIPSTRYGFALPRWANEDVELSHGVVIPAGDAILPERSVANRDEATFPHGWELDLHRESPAPHLSLGLGSHHCMGANLAHLEIEVVLERLLTRFPTLDLAVAPDDVKWSGSSFMRGVAALPVTW